MAATSTDDLVHPRDDRRSVDELFLVTLCECDEDRVWAAIGTLRWRGTREILDRARTALQEPLRARKTHRCRHSRPAWISDPSLSRRMPAYAPRHVRE